MTDPGPAGARLRVHRLREATAGLSRQARATGPGPARAELTR
jgi:hypothetical protein